VDRFARVAGLSGIGQAAASARDGIDVVLRQPDVRRRAGRIAAAAAVRGADASAALEAWSGSGVATPGPTVAAPDRDDPLWLGALRATGAVLELAPTWSRAPLQVLARLHVLVAADLVGSEQLGRPVDAEAARRLTEMTADLAAGTTAPALVVAALVHATVAEAFAPAGGIVGRAAERVVLVATGLDPQNLLVPEAGHLAAAEGYLSERADAVSGLLAGPARWTERCCRAYTYAAEQTALLAVEAGVPGTALPGAAGAGG
jgi:hypothetical protein